MKPISPKTRTARSATLSVLHALDEGCPIQEALANVRATVQLHAQDQHLLQELCYGVPRTEYRLTTILNHYLPNQTRLPPTLLHIFQIALYQILFLERIPDHAILATAVAEAKQRFGTSMGNLTNALLHTLLTDKMAFCDPAWYRRREDPKEDQPLHALARFYSIPYWLLSSWKDTYGLGAAIALAKRSFTQPSLGLLFNTTNHPLWHTLTHAAIDGIERVSPLGFSLTPDCYRTLCKNADIQKLHNEGVLSFLSPGSQKVLAALGLHHWDKPIWDMCAGFGGKSGYAATFGIPVALCTDISWKRLSALTQDFRRRHLPIPACVLADANTPPLRSFAGHILLDAPCSGLGILARRPDIKRKRQKKRSLRIFPPQQKALLQSALRLLQKNCFLAYITCTINPAENGALIRDLLTQQDLTLEYEWQTPNDACSLDGMYGALLRRRSGP